MEVRFLLGWGAMDLRAELVGVLVRGVEVAEEVFEEPSCFVGDLAGP